MSNFGKHIIIRSICIICVGFSVLVPSTIQAQQQSPTIRGISVVPYFGIGTAFGDLDVLYRSVYPIEYSNEARSWQFQSGYNFTAKILLMQSPLRNDKQSHLVAVGLLLGVDASLIPRDAKQFIDSEGVHDSSYARLREDVLYLAPSVLLQPRKLPFQFLFAFGINRRVWNRSDISGAPLENTTGTSLIALLRYHSFWAGISIHHGQSVSSVTDFFRGDVFTPVEYSASTLWLHIGVCGWTP